MTVVNRGEFSLNGFRNRDLRCHLYPTTKDKQKQHKEMAAVGRRLRLLRAHGLIAKVPKTHCYIVTEKGRKPHHGFVGRAQRKHRTTHSLGRVICADGENFQA